MGFIVFGFLLAAMNTRSSAIVTTTRRFLAISAFPALEST
jgi:hypothetical protein